MSTPDDTQTAPTSPSDPQAALFVRLWKEGVPVDEIARRLKIGTTTVHDRRQRLGLLARARPAKPADGELEIIRKAWFEGKSATEISKLLRSGRSRNSVIGIVHRNGWSNRQTPARLINHASNPTRPAPHAERHAVVRPRLPKMAVPFAGTVQPIGAEAEAARERRIALGKAALRRVELADIASPNARPFMDAPMRGVCKWPIGEGLTMLVCCNTLARGPWCAEHATVGFERIQPSPSQRGDRNAASLTRHDRVALAPKAERSDDGLWDMAA